VGRREKERKKERKKEERSGERQTGMQNVFGDGVLRNNGCGINDGIACGNIRLLQFFMYGASISRSVVTRRERNIPFVAQWCV